jgi:hypothetical protein
MLRAVSITLVALSSVSAQAAVWTFATPLSGDREYPPNASTATGFALVEFDDATHMMTVSATFSGLIGTTNAAHIHCCVSPGAPTPTAGVATTTPTFPGFPLGVTSGTYANTLDMTLAGSYNPAFVTAHGGVAGAEAFLLAGLIAGEAYFNIHTTAYPGGEIRGFLFEVIFMDGFESGDSTAWDFTSP